MTTHRPSAEVSTSSMADIAFLLLTFFLMTTVINNYRGIPMILPQLLKDPQPVNEGNIFSIQIKSKNAFLIEGKPRQNLLGMKEEIKRFILNNNSNPSLSENPEKPLVSLKTDRGTSYESFIEALDEIHAAYLEIYAERANMSVKEFRNLDLKIASNKIIHDKAKEGIPMNISIAEPTKVGDQ
jgi:biopolymer transport protein ExbD